MDTFTFTFTMQDMYHAAYLLRDSESSIVRLCVSMTTVAPERLDWF